MWGGGFGRGYFLFWYFFFNFWKEICFLGFCNLKNLLIKELGVFECVVVFVEFLFGFKV